MYNPDVRRSESETGRDTGLSTPPALRELMLGQAIDAAGYVVLVADYWMRYLEVSSGACELLGYSRDELLELTVPDVVVETHADELYDEMVERGSQRGHVTLRTKSGTHVQAQYDARETSVGGMTYYVSVLTPLDPVATPSS